MREMTQEEESERCEKCGSTNIKETPSIYEDEEGNEELNHDTQQAVCLNCGKEWIVVYI